MTFRMPVISFVVFSITAAMKTLAKMAKATGQDVGLIDILYGGVDLDKEFINPCNSRKENYNSTSEGKCYHSDWKFTGNLWGPKQRREAVLLKSLGLTKQQISNYFDNPLKIEIPASCYYDDKSRNKFLRNWKYIADTFYAIAGVEFRKYLLYEKDDTLLIISLFEIIDNGGDGCNFTCFQK